METSTTTPATEWLTVEQFAAEYGFSPASIRQWRYRGTGPASVRLGARIRYRRTDIDAWIAERFEAEAKRRKAKGGSP